MRMMHLIAKVYPESREIKRIHKPGIQVISK